MSDIDLESIKAYLVNKGDDSLYNEPPLSRRIFSKEKPEVIAASWVDSFSDPARHDDSHFRYLVHGFQGGAGDIIQAMSVIEQKRRGRLVNMGEKIDLLLQPDRIGDKKIISASVIDQDHRTTFGEAGLILKTPAQNVLDTSPDDMGTDFYDQDAAIAKSKRVVCSVGELLNASALDQWNEVLLLGATEGGRVSVKGFWIKVDEDGNPLDGDTATRLAGLASATGIPMVRIVEKSKNVDLRDTRASINGQPEMIVDDGVERMVEVPWGLSFNRGGLRYFIDFKKNTFDVIDDKGKSRTMTPDEFDYAISIIDKELDPREKEKVADVLASLPAKFEEIRQAGNGHQKRNGDLE